MRQLVLLTLSLSTLAVGTAESQAPSRRIDKGQWAAASRYPSELDTILINPILLAAKDSIVVVYDAGEGSLKGFADGNRLRWRFGRKGKGPKEFAQVTDVAVSPSGDVWINDPGNVRITVLTRDGAFRYSLSTSVPLHRIVPLRDSTYLALDGNTSFLSRYDALGGRQPLLTPKDLSTLARHTTEAAFILTPHKLVATAFRWSSSVMLTDTTGVVVWRNAGPDPAPFPELVTQKVKIGGRSALVSRITPRAEQSAISIAIDGNSLYVLQAVPTPAGNSIMDVYDLISGQYLGSDELLFQAGAITFAKGRLYALINDPFPQIVVAERTQ